MSHRKFTEMGTNLNFKNFGNDPPADGGGDGRLPGSFSLTREPSIYSLTFDEFQSTVGGTGKDFGSMNMDELLKNIWSAEENQNLGPTSGGAGQEGSGYLQRQGSLTLPRTLSQKTVDEVWRNMSKEGAGGGISGFGVPQRQQTLGEITIEEFLVRARVVREETQLASKLNNLGSLGDLNSSGLGLGYQQQLASRDAGLMSGVVPESSYQIAMRSSGDLPLSVNGLRPAAQQVESHQLQKPQKQLRILPKQPALACGSTMGIPDGDQLSSPQITSGMVHISNLATANNAALQDGGLGVVGLGANGATVATASPALSSDGYVTKSNGDISSVSPVPYVFNAGFGGRRSAALEKVVERRERRQRRMIKNRESAARSRARKQAYTTELEAEVAKLKKEREELQKKQEEMMEKQKNQVLEMMKHQNGAKRQCLRRTQTDPW